MHRYFKSALLALPLFALAAPALAESVPQARPAPLAELVEKVDIPYEEFTLPNGLTTIVHTDRKVPIVGVTLYYRIGSKHEPRGRTGFAHLYEHLFFGGSANAPNFDKPLEAAGSTTTNGSTWYDRTNYVETVPSGALELALFLESDRMGYLLPAVTQEKLDNQRAVVQNEKRQGDNQPYALMDYAQAEGLFPVGHPYRHATIGSMADLEAATLTDVRKWFADNYGPNNAVLVLAGDIDAATARPLVEKWFGAIPRGPEVPTVKAEPVTLAAPQTREIADQVPVTRLTRNWSGPGLNAEDAAALDIGMHVLGGLASSRLDNELVRGSQVAVRVSASAQMFEQVSFVEISMDVKPGVERAVAEAKLDEVVNAYLAEGPTEDEVRRAVTSTVSAEIGALELVGGFSGKGATLAEGKLYSNDPLHFRKNLERMAALTPAEIRAAMNKWLSRPVFTLVTVPGERTESGETMGGWGDEAERPAPTPDPRAPVAAAKAAPARAAPPLGEIGNIDFPDVERAQLSNGIPVALVRRTAVPKLAVSLMLDAGIAGDALDAPATQHMVVAMLDEGTATMNATQIAEAQERLGASIGMSVNLDTSQVTMSALSANLYPSLQLMADLVLNPAFAPEEVERVRQQKLASLAQTLANPAARANRAIGPLIYKGHPYAQPSDGLGDEASLKAITPEALKAAHTEWFRPDLARITVVGDTTMANLLPQLEDAFGSWGNPARPKPVKDLTAAIPEQAARIVLIDQPGAAQSVIFAGRVLPLNGTDADQEAVALANDVVGGGFLSRLNDDLRETKGWSYGVFSGVRRPMGPRAFVVQAPVQADRTGDAIAAIRQILSDFPGKTPMNEEELERVIEGNIRGLAHNLETNGQVLYAVLDNDVLGRPDNYYETLADRYRALGAKRIEEAAAQFLKPEGLTWVVVGDRKSVEPQLADLGLPVEILDAEE
ncbi:MAG: pitrilysin family protein [Sphingomonadaceae bacterium]